MIGRWLPPGGHRIVGSDAFVQRPTYKVHPQWGGGEKEIPLHLASVRDVTRAKRPRRRTFNYGYVFLAIFILLTLILGMDLAYKKGQQDDAMVQRLGSLRP